MSDEKADLIAYMGDVQFIDNTGAEAKRERGKAYEIVRRAYATGKAAGAAAEKARWVALIEARIAALVARPIVEWGSAHAAGQEDGLRKLLEKVNEA